MTTRHADRIVATGTCAYCQERGRPLVDEIGVLICTDCAPTEAELLARLEALRREGLPQP